MMLDLQSDHFCSHKQGCCFWNLLDSETRAQISWVFQLESLNQGPPANSVFSVTERHPHPVVQLPKLVSLIPELVGWSVGPWGPLPDLHWRGGAWYWYCRPAFCHSVPWSQSWSTLMPKKLEDRSFVVCSLYIYNYITVKGFMYSNLLVDKGIYEFVPSCHQSKVLLAWLPLSGKNQP